MPEPAATPICDSTRGSDAIDQPIVHERPSRFDLPTLWAVASFDDRHPRFARFIVTLIRPPIVSRTEPPLACEVIAPPRTSVASLMLCAAGLAVAVAATLVSFAAPVWFAIVALPTGALAGVLLIERGLAHFVIPPGHVRLQDVVARRQGSGIAHEVLNELLSTIDRPVVLEVDADAVGVVRLYQRLGFTRSAEGASKPGTVTMTRPASTSMGDLSFSTIAGVHPRWLWPSLTEILIGVIAVIAMAALHQPGTWSRHVVVGVAVFAVVTAAGTDLRLHRIPNALIGASLLPLLWISTGTNSVDQALIGVLILAGPLLASNLVTGGRSPGLGDAKLAAVAGAALGMIVPVDDVVAALLITLIGGAMFGAIYQRRTHQPGFPLAPAIGASTIAVLILGGLELRNLT